MVPAQQAASVGQRDPVLLNGHDPMISQQPQHASQRVLVGIDGRCQFRDRQWPGCQSLRDLQPRDRADAMADEPNLVHIDQGLIHLD